MEKQVFKWEFFGFLVTFGIGSILHFVFEWSRYWQPVALFGAVNESTWEHLKMAFWPMMLWLLVEGALIKKEHLDVRNFVIAKAIGAYVTPLTIIVGFYSYLALGFTSNLASGLTFFAVGVFVGYMVSALVMSAPKWQKSTFVLGIVLLVFVTVCFLTFTYLPPQNFLFLDPNTGMYGIPT